MTEVMMTHEKIVRGGFKVPKILDPMRSYVEVRITQLEDGTIKVNQEKSEDWDHAHTIITFAANGAMSIAHEREKMISARESDYSNVKDQYSILPFCKEMLANGDVSDADARKLSLRMDLALKDCKAKVSGKEEHNVSYWKTGR